MLYRQRFGVLVLPALFFILAISLGPNESLAKDQTWGKISDSAQRFQTLANFGNAAVLDRETGLVWEQCPSTDAVSWSAAKNNCFRKQLGGRMGWRLPSMEEMSSLGDTNANPFLPNSGAFCSTASKPCATGFPGCDVGPGYWTTTIDQDPTQGFVLGIKGSDGPTVGYSPTLGMAQYWCVRGGQYSQAPKP